MYSLSYNINVTMYLSHQSSNYSISVSLYSMNLFCFVVVVVFVVDDNVRGSGVAEVVFFWNLPVLW